MLTYLKAILIISICVFLTNCKLHEEPTASKSEPITVSKVQEQSASSQPKPPKPARIKLHRNAKGEYSWDITADSVDEVIKADSKLRRFIKAQQDK